jgi:hypothetical protein
MDNEDDDIMPPLVDHQTRIYGDESVDDYDEKYLNDPVDEEHNGLNQCTPIFAPPPMLLPQSVPI